MRTQMKGNLMKRLFPNALFFVLLIAFSVPAYSGDFSEDFVLPDDTAPLLDREITEDGCDGFITLADYKNLEITAPDGTVAENGMTVSISYTGEIRGEKADGLTAQNVMLLIGSGTMTEEFENQLVGHRAGERMSIDVDYPDDFFDDNLAGERVSYDVEIGAVYITPPDIAFSMVADGSVVTGYPESMYESWKSVYEGLYASFDEAGTDAPAGDFSEDPEELDRMIYASMKNELTARAILDAEGIGAEDDRFLQAEAVMLKKYGFKTTDDMMAAGYSETEILYETMYQASCSVLLEYAA